MVGENGAGKSTLIRIITETIQPSAGRMWLNGEPVRFDRPRDGERRGIAAVHQELPLLEMRTVAENVYFGHEPSRYGFINGRVYAIGDNRRTARLMGLNETAVLVPVYALSGALAGLAGVTLASRLGMGQPVAGAGWELDAIAAVVVGGTLLTGGSGGAGATVVGVLLLGFVFNVFNLEGTISSWWQWILRGLFLLGVALLQKRIPDTHADST